jgi:16S rRNA processing protein RimM
MKEDAEYLTIARITRPRGNKGEVAADDLVGNMRFFESGGKVEVVLPNRARLELEIERAWEHRGRLMLKFAGVGTIPDAERLRLAEVQVRKDSLEALPEGEYYFDDLVGCSLVDEATGRELGSIAEVYEPPGGMLLLSVVDEGKQEMLVPFANEICREVDTESKRVLVRLPDGMEDLKA